MNVYKNIMCDPKDHLATIYVKSNENPNIHICKEVDISELNAALDDNRVHEFMPNLFAPMREKYWVVK